MAQPTSRSRAPLAGKRVQNDENIPVSTQSITYVKDALSSVQASKGKAIAIAPTTAVRRSRIMGEVIGKENSLKVSTNISNINTQKNVAPVKERAQLMQIKREPNQASIKREPTLAQIQKQVNAPPPAAAVQPSSRKVLQERERNIARLEPPPPLRFKQVIIKSEPAVKVEPIIKTEPIFKIEPVIKTEPAIKIEPAIQRIKSVAKRALAPVAADSLAELKGHKQDALDHEEEENKKRRKRDEKLQWDDLDADDTADPLMVSEYVVDIFKYLLKLEKATMPYHDYMTAQKELAWKMRGVLVDWLAEVHNKFKLLPETLFLAVNLIDRFLSVRTVSLVKFQLVGVTALFIAAKYEEVLAPSIVNYVFMADGGFTDQEILVAERYMLGSLGFQLSYPSPMNFLRRISKADNYDIHSRTVAKYLMEIPLLDHGFLSCRPSMVSAAALCLARRMMGNFEWDDNLIHYSGYTLEELIPCMERMIHFIQQTEMSSTFIFRKYATKRFMKASIFVREWVFQLERQQTAAAECIL